MKKQRKIFSLVGLIFTGTVLITSTALARPIELSLSLIIPSQHLRYIHVLEPWQKMIEERSQGKVKITPYFSCALAPIPEIFDSTVAGIADISEGIAYATPGRFPLSETVMLPELGFKTSLNSSRALWKAYEEFPEVKAEYAGVKMLWLHCSSRGRIVTRDKPVKSLEDLKGLKIRVSGSTAVKTAKALGYTPVSIPMGDVYLALERGVLDGTVANWEILVSRRFGEVTKYLTELDLGQDTFFVVMNLNAWNKLPPDIQKVFEEFSGEWAVEFTGKGWDRFEQEAEERLLAKGFQKITLPPEEAVRWKERLAPIREEWANELEGKGLPGKKLVDMFQRLGQGQK